MLKTLEEPPDYLKFVLATTDPQKVPVTVLSRCLQFNLKQLAPAMIAGYLKDEAATGEAWAQGWFHTGDIVRRDAQGLLHFIDRRKNVIRRSGENISAVEVEGVLNQFAAVKVSAVAATPDALRGDVLASLGYVANWRFLASGQSYAASWSRPAGLTDGTYVLETSRSSGFTNRALITPTWMPSSASSRAAARQFESSVPNAMKQPSSPHSMTSALPISRGWRLP
jgi:hypothetical protein